MGVGQPIFGVFKGACGRGTTPKAGAFSGQHGAGCGTGGRTWRFGSSGAQMACAKKCIRRIVFPAILRQTAKSIS